MRMNKAFAFLAMLAAVAVAAPASAQQIKLRMSTENPVGSPSTTMLAAFRDALKAELGDRLTVEFFDSGSLGDEALHLDMIRTGQIQVAPLGSDVVQLAPEWAVFDMPFLFTSREAAARVLDGAIGREMGAAMRKRVNIEVLGFGEVGFRQITNSVRPIVKPTDLAGLRLRVPGSKTRILTFQMLGAHPITMNANELYLGLQSKTVDGQENPLSVISFLSLFEVQPFTSLSRHVYTPVTLVMHGPTFDGLDEKAKAAVRKAATIAIQATRDAGAKADATLLERIATKSKINEIDVAAFQAAAKPIWAEIAKVAGADLTAKVVAEVTK